MAKKLVALWLGWRIVSRHTAMGTAYWVWLAPDGCVRRREPDWLTEQEAAANPPVFDSFDDCRAFEDRLDAEGMLSTYLMILGSLCGVAGASVHPYERLEAVFRAPVERRLEALYRLSQSPLGVNYRLTGVVGSSVCEGGNED